MIPISATETINFTPAYYEGKPDAPVYHLAVPTLKGRAAFKRMLGEEGARHPSNMELLELLRDGVRFYILPEDQDFWLEKIDQYEIADAQEKTQLAIEIHELENAITRYYAPYSAALADRQYWLEIAPLAAAQLFLRGWEGVETPFALQAGSVKTALLEKLPDGDVVAIGFYAISLMMPTKEQEKNFASPPPSPPDPEISAVENTQPMAAWGGKLTE